jgi:hypothetical protein
MTNEELTAIEARANAATPGPWEGKTNSGMVSTHDAYGTVFETGCGCCTDNGLSAEDAAFISAARVDVPALVAEVRRLRALVESAYREGFYDGEDDAPIGELPAGYGDTAWWMSDARKALEVQP